VQSGCPRARTGIIFAERGFPASFAPSRFIRHDDGAWRVEDIPSHLLPDCYRRIGALTPEERTQRRDETRARTEFDAIIRRTRAWTRAA